MWRKFTFTFTQTNRRESEHFRFQQVFNECLTEAEEPDYILLLEATKDRATKRTYYLHCAPWEQCFVRLVKEFSYEETEKPFIGETRQVHPAVPLVTDQIISSAKNAAATLSRSREQVRVWQTKGIEVPPGQTGGTLSDYDIAGEWQIECGESTFPLRLTLGQTRDLQQGRREGVESIIRQELTRRPATV